MRWNNRAQRLGFLLAAIMLLGLGIINILNTPLYYVYAVSAMVAIDPRLTLAGGADPGGHQGRSDGCS